MEEDSDESPPSDDAEAWRQILEENRLSACSIEAIVAAVQDLDPNRHRRIVESLADWISKKILGTLRRYVSRRYPNEGNDIIDQAHEVLICALLAPESKDGAALRKAFYPRVKFRALDAVKKAQLQRDRYPSIDDVEGEIAETTAADNALASQIQVELILDKICDPRKRLAFRLHMDGVPITSKKAASIEAVCGVSAKTIGDWIKEVRKELKAHLGDVK